MVSRRQERILAAFEALSDAVARALGAADGARDAAVRAHAETMAEMWLRTDGLDSVRADPALRALLTNPQLADVVQRVDADRTAAFTGWLDRGPAQLAGLLEIAAPGAAGGPAHEWLGSVGEIDGAGPVPTLWHV
ncbi:MAG TPA: cell division protein FtsK, partial [Pseudonocardia sp.]|nr:cell division protein FtsK [Pseudonocardia sp.]